MRLIPLIALGLGIGAMGGLWLQHARPDRAEAHSAPSAIGSAATAPSSARAMKAASTDRPSLAAPVQSPAAASSNPGPAALLLPVQGIEASQLRDTFTDARSEGRVHDAIDIMADTGTPVLAVADGTVEKLFDSERGGLTIYQFEPSGQWCYYYAHLQRYADGLAEKQVIKRGEVIGYVGSTGNASAEAPHLHFEVHALGAEKQWWKGESINPYPLLRGTR